MFKWLKKMFGAKPVGSTESARATTEFAAEVVRIASVDPHPNADRLELIRFEMKGLGVTGYTVVSQKGSWKPGDLAAYFSVDCMLPVSHPEFAFLKERTTKSVYRLRAARLRGVFSQGLLVKAPANAAYGLHIAESFGVTYHTDPEASEPNGPNKTKRKAAQPMPVYGVASLKKDPNIFAVGEEVLVTEKIHGTNFRFGWVRRRFLGIPVGWRFVVGSHRAIKGTGQGGDFYGEDLWTRYAQENDLAARTADFKGHIFFGELYGRTYGGAGIQDLTYGVKSGPEFALFDVLSPRGYLFPDARREVARACGLLNVPAYYRGPWGDDLKEMAEGRSHLCLSQIREGIVVESVSGERKKAKFVGEGYLTRKVKEAA